MVGVWCVCLCGKWAGLWNSVCPVGTEQTVHPLKCPPKPEKVDCGALSYLWNSFHSGIVSFTRLKFPVSDRVFCLAPQYLTCLFAICSFPLQTALYTTLLSVN